MVQEQLHAVVHLDLKGLLPPGLSISIHHLIRGALAAVCGV
jgi:hypothetical protein